MGDAIGLAGLSVKQVIDHMRESVIITDSRHNILAVNDAFTRVTGYDPADVLGKNPRFLKSGEHKAPFYTKMWGAVAVHGFWQGEITNRRKNGEIYAEWLTISAIKNRDGQTAYYLGVFTDITKRKRAQETIRHMAFYDALTDLPNRAMFQEELRHAMTQADRQREMLGVLFLDLDRVKVINDSLGHDMGDRILKGVAARLQGCLRGSDVVARLGGDEFMLLLPGIKHRSEVLLLADKILKAVQPPFQLDKHELFITASLGIALYPQDGTDTHTLLRNADAAMYSAKKQGRNNFQVFDPTMKKEALEQLTVDNGLRRALERNELVIHYQPQIEIGSGHIIGMEALVRWNHPELGLLPPSTFIQWAEDSGLIVPIGEHILRMACLQSKTWMDRGLGTIKVGVNVSAKQLRHSDLIHVVQRALEDTNLPPECLDLELTESVLMDLRGTAMDIPHTLKSMGVGFSIDDFGTGYSSLNYLKRLPVSTLKMDQSFVRDLSGDASNATIANAIIGLGHGLNLNVLAEGVETQSQLDHLRTLKCDQVQGYLFSEPLPADVFENLLREKRNLHARGTLFENLHN